MAEAITHSPLSLRGLSGPLNEKEIVEGTDKSLADRSGEAFLRFWSMESLQSLPKGAQGRSRGNSPCMDMEHGAGGSGSDGVGQ